MTRESRRGRDPRGSSGVECRGNRGISGPDDIRLANGVECRALDEVLARIAGAQRGLVTRSQFHSTRSAFERDHAKDRYLRSRSLIVLRYIAEQAEHELEAILVEVATTLTKAAAA